MEPEMKDIRTAHCEGHTEIGFDCTGSYLITAGKDGDVRIYNGLDDDSEKSIKVGNSATALAVSDTMIAVANQSNTVLSYTCPMGEFDSMLIRFTGAVNDVSISRNGKMLAAGSSDLTIKTLHLANKEQKTFNGHTAPVLSVALDPDGQFLASSSCDGTLRVWDITTQECIKHVKMFPVCNDVSTASSLCRIRWCPKKLKGFAVASGNKLKVVSSENWDEVFSLNEENSKLITAICWSPCGSYLVSGSTNGEIIVWDCANRSVAQRFKHESDVRICSLDWNQSGKPELCFADDQGQFSICADVVKVLKVSQRGQDATGNLMGMDTTFDDDMDVVAEMRDLNDDEDDPIVGSRKKHKIHNIDKLIDDEADEDSNYSDDANISLNLIKEGFLPSTLRPTNEQADSVEEFKQKPREEKPRVVMQKPFQPGSTPAHLMHRFMVWNSIGIVRAHSEDDIATIDIEFHDTSTHHPLHLDNALNFTMAALSMKAVVFACEAEDEEPSKLQCIHLETWDSNKEWTISLPKGESFKALAVNKSLIAAATNHQLIRVFTIGGMQYQMFSIPGPVVAMAMHDYQLVVIYHQGTGLPNCQCLGVKVLEFSRSGCKTIAEQQLPLSHKSSLVWLGFSDEGTPVIVDSKGVIRMLQRSFGPNWVPVFDIKTQAKTKSDNCWVIGMKEGPPQVRYIFCKGAQFPATIPRPVPSYCAFSLPLCEGDTEKGQMEEEYMRNNLITSNQLLTEKKRKSWNMPIDASPSTEQLALLMKMFALACKSGRDFRALEICDFMPNARTVSLAIQYATKMRKMKLAQRLDNLARDKAELEEQLQEEQSDIDDEVERVPHQSSNNSFSKTRLSNQVSVSGRHISPGFPLRAIKKKENEIQKSGTGESSNEEDGDDAMSDDDVSENCVDNDQSLENGGSYKTDTPSSQQRFNPFKARPKVGVSISGTPRGTSYFETLESKRHQKAKPVLVSGQKNDSKRGDVASNEKSKRKQKTLLGTPSESIEPKQQGVKKNSGAARQERITGFQMFLRDTLQGNPENADPDEIRNMTEKWRSLESEKKKEWNEKAKDKNAFNGTTDEHNDQEIQLKQQNGAEKKRKRTLDSTEHTDAHKAKKKISEDKDTKESKSKIASFAFSKK